jgi:23S rRNA G2445 N2-methylase RlmL
LEAAITLNQYIVTELAKKAGAQDLKPDEDGFTRTSVAAALTEKAQAILASSLWGYDIDQTMVRLGLMNLMMHGIDEPHIDYKDTLSKSYTEESEYDIVMANPPFAKSGMSATKDRVYVLQSPAHVVGPAKFRFRFSRDYTKAVAA